MSKVICLLILIFCCGTVFSANTTDSLLKVLDQVIAGRNRYQQDKETQLAQLKNKLVKASDHQAQYKVCAELFDLYLPYNTDSALYYAHQKHQLAKVLNHKTDVCESQINMAAVLCITGNYKESVDILQRVRSMNLTDTLFQYYHHISCSVYGAMAYFTAVNYDRLHYRTLTNSYRDSILMFTPAGTVDYNIAMADHLIVTGRHNDALQLLHQTSQTIPPDSHYKAIVNYLLSDAYAGTGNRELARQFLVASSIADIRAVVKEYISLWKLATMLHEDGDTYRAYNYLKCSLEDAIFSNARLRTIKISQIYPIIDKAYQAKSQKQHRQMMVLLMVISILSVLLIVAVVYVSMQMRKLSIVKRQLSQTNQQLVAINDQLRQTNLSLSEVSNIKETYIGRYMDLCSVYIEKMDDYRRMLNKMATAGKMDDLFHTIKSTQFIDNELKEFYTNFDDTFLRLFPTFVDDFNALLNDNEAVAPKPGEQLNTELRIYALIRLGITDSEKIAHFLRYSVTTIYNYRTKLRNKAAGVRNDFEKKVMQIGVERLG